MSMSCPKCQGKAPCLESRKKGDLSVRRRYRCSVCDCKFNTVETIVIIDGVKRSAGLSDRPGTLSNDLRIAVLKDLLEREIGK